MNAPTREEFLAQRMKGIGGSDAGTIMGANPYKTAYELYLEKRQELEAEDIGDKLPVKIGIDLEDFVAKEYQDQTGFKVQRFNNQLQHPDHPWMLGNLDRVVSLDGKAPAHKGELRTKRLLECKTALGRFLDKTMWGPSGTDQVPEHYFFQCMHYLAVSGADQIDLAVLLAGPEVRIYHIVRDEELIALMIKVEGTFWQQVQSGKAPEMDFNHPTTGALLDRLYPGTDGSTIELPATAEHWQQVMADAKEQKALYEKVAEGAKNHILHLMGNAAIAKLPDGTAFTRKVIKKKAFSVEATEYVDFRYTKNPKE
ncbi:YqaJ viral recombinase family protein [Chitinibacter bivalviorum]|uniref:YqaJ viral recombinase family protein n=1 Tax=Chitinibacter bivalviorum TaxID=2739434 RepID=A0A7H9BG31_9NEIS|nr:YqaJ viral recombinase family protein [Chitinibacter bivalviorum]QLG87673.1 YqaJ viral recombinase family protein [Chitinibacter bivalviorum]